MSHPARPSQVAAQPRLLLASWAALMALAPASGALAAPSPAPKASSAPVAKPTAAPVAKPVAKPDAKAPAKKPADDLYGPPTPGSPMQKGPDGKPMAPIDTEAKTTIREIKVVGNVRIGEDRILLSIPISPGDRVGRSGVLDGIQRIYGLGYFRDVKAGTEPMLGGERLIFQVVENPTMRSHTVEGMTKIEQAKVDALLKPMHGEIINYNAIKDVVDKVQKLYADGGYPLARVADMDVSPTGQLYMRVSEGKIHAIKVKGNEETKEYVVLRELSTKPGEVFNAEKIKVDLRRVYNLNYFEDINLKFEPAPPVDGKNPEEVIVVIEVKEKQTGSINLGAGYSTRDGILGMFSVKKDNLLGTGQQVGLDLSVSQQWRVAGELNYFNPWFDENRTGLGGSLFLRRFNNFLADFREDRMGTSINMSRPLFGGTLGSPWRGTLGLRGETITTYDNVFVGGNKKSVYPDGRPITLNPEGTDNIVGGTLGITYDTRDIIINPTEGWFNTLTLDPGVVNGNSPLVRGSANMTYFHPLWTMPWAPTERSTFAVNGRLGLIGGSQVPAYERFFSTGPYLVRGWPEFVSPTMAVAQKYGTNYFQGSNAFVGSLEYRFPVFNIVSGVFFADSGMFWDDKFTPQSLLHFGYGAGVRLTTPLGPIRLDYGMSGVETGQFHFSIGQKF